MGIDDFGTSGPRTSSASGSKQKDLEDRVLSNFEEEWNMTTQEAARDPEFIAGRIEDGWDTEKFCAALSFIEHSVIQLYAKAVQETDLELSEVPDIDHPDFRDKHAKYYVKAIINNKSLDKVGSSSSSSSTSTSSSTGSGLDSFRN